MSVSYISFLKEVFHHITNSLVNQHSKHIDGKRWMQKNTVNIYVVEMVLICDSGIVSSLLFVTDVDLSE